MADQDQQLPADARYPRSVVSEEDRTRWDNAGVVARKVLGEDATAAAVLQTQGVIYADRETYPS